MPQFEVSPSWCISPGIIILFKCATLQFVQGDWFIADRLAYFIHTLNYAYIFMKLYMYDLNDGRLFDK